MAKKQVQYLVVDRAGVVQPGSPYPDEDAAEAAVAKRLASDLRVGAPAAPAQKGFYVVPVAWGS